MSDRKSDFRIDLKQQELDSNFLKSINLYKNIDPSKAQAFRLNSLEGTEASLTRQHSIGSHSGSNTGGFPGPTNGQVVGGQSQPINPIELSDDLMPKLSLKQSIQRSKTSVIEPDQATLALILETSKPDTPFQFDIPIAQIQAALDIDMSPVIPSPIPRVVKFNELGNKNLKYSYTILTNLMFESTPDQPSDIPQTESSEARDRRLRGSGPVEEEINTHNIDTNEDDLDNFSEAEYSAHAQAEDSVDRPEKIRKLMEKQLKISKQEEKFMRKLESLKRNFEGGKGSNQTSERASLSIKELELIGQRVLEEKSMAKKMQANAKAASTGAATQVSPAINSERRQDEFITKYQMHMEQQRMVAEMEKLAVSQPGNPQTIAWPQAGSKRIEEARDSQQSSRDGQGGAAGNGPGNYNEADSMNFKSTMSDMEPNFENVKSLNFFISPHGGSSNFIKNEYLEYVGISNTGAVRGSLRGPDPHDQGFLKQVAEKKIVFSKEPSIFAADQVPIADLTAPKTFEPGHEKASIFSDSQSGSNEHNFPFNEEPPSESFDYFKQGGGDGQEEAGDPFEDAKKHQPIYSDYHHYKQGYFKRHYEPYAEDIDRIYKKEVPGFNEPAPVEDDAFGAFPFQNGRGELDGEDGEDNPLRHVQDIGKFGYQGRGGAEDEMDDQNYSLAYKVHLFKNEILNQDIGVENLGRVESDKLALPDTEQFDATKYFSFTK